MNMTRFHESWNPVIDCPQRHRRRGFAPPQVEEESASHLTNMDLGSYTHKGNTLRGWFPRIDTLVVVAHIKGEMKGGPP